MPTLFSSSSPDKKRRWSSSAQGPPAPPKHRNNKPPRLSLSFHKSASTTNVSETTTPIRKRLSSFLTTSPITFRNNAAAIAEAEEEEDMSLPSITHTASCSSSDDLASPVTSDSVLSDYVKPLGLAQLVQKELGSVIKQVDEEIDGEWEHSRRILRQSLSLPVGII